MPKVRRFFYVAGPKSTVLHRFYGSKVEGNPTLCGRTMRKGWEWALKWKSDLPRCKRCEGAVG